MTLALPTTPTARYQFGHLIKGIRSCSPPREEEAQSNSLEHPADQAYSNSIEGPLLGDDVANKLLYHRVSFRIQIRYRNIHTLGAELAIKTRLPK